MAKPPNPEAPRLRIPRYIQRRLLDELWPKLLQAAEHHH